MTDDNESYYGGGNDAPTATDESGGDASEESAETKTALINSSICPGMHPGDKLELTIERVLDSGEYECSYDPDSKDESSETSEAPSGDAEMASYMQ